ncbi:MAG: GyrI-like domain-containing protein [SAR324 cluster bacterium]|nr:GyrI-like domain-containing protein [SAR324 cluster bacterium]
MTEPKIIFLKACLVAGFTATIGSFQEDNQKAIAELWAKLKASLTEPLPPFRVAVMPSPAKPDEGVPEEAGPVEYMAGIFVNSKEDAPSGSLCWEIPNGEYAEFIHLGPMKNILKTYQDIYGTWLPSSGRTLGAGPEIGMYAMDAKPNSDEMTVKIMIPLESGLKT